MDRISPSTTRARLRRVRLSQPDRAVLDALLAELGEERELPVERAQQVLFAGRTPAAATKAVERLVKLVNTAAAEDGVDLHLEVRGAKKSGARRRLLGFSAERVEPAGDPLREHEAVRDELIEGRQATLLGPRKIVLCHAREDAELAGKLWDLLTQALDCDQSLFTFWRPDRDVLAGDDADQQFREAVADGEVAIVALSNAWLGQPELGEVVRGQIEATGLLVAPVALREHNPHAIAPGFGTTYPQDPHGKPFADLRGEPARDKWVHGLVDQVHRRLARSSGAVRTTRAVSSPDMGLLDRRALSAEGGDGYYGLHGRPEGMQPDLRPDPQPGERRVDVVSFLLNWARDPDGTPLAALLGEYGAGKTITCQELTERLRRDRVGDQPEPLYFDLRGVGNLDRGVPALAEILTDCIHRGWASADGPLPSGAEVIAQARMRPTLFVIDGLDEVLVRLDAAQGVTFTHELLKLRPIRTRQGIRAPFAGEHTKVLLSCRTHYFRSLREQSRHFLEQDRDLTKAEDYTALVLLPLTEEQIHDYLSKALPGRDATQVTDMLRAVHDLSDLATRPYTLAKVAAQIPFIERRHAEQRPVHAATIYRQVLRDWLARDRGKHRLRPDHKLTLMARLAAWSWQRGSRRVDSADLDDWLDEQLATDPVLSRRYRDSSRDQLEEDLRTATFVIRSDDNGPDRPDFRFAHSSIHEYFLAQYLCDALREGRRQDWCLPMPSVETLDFLGQLITDDDDPDALTAELGRWRAPYTAQTSELRLRYTLWARDHGWPHPTLAGSDLTGASLRGWRFTGTDTDPLILTATTLTGADLRDTRWDHVTLTQATLSGARLDRATLHDTTITAGTLRDANLSGAFLHHCRLDGTDLTGITTHQLRHIGSGTTLPTPAHPTSTHLHALTGHTGGVWGVAFSPDGTRLATTSADQTARLWDSTTGEPLLTLTGHTDGVWGVAFSPDGTRLATTSFDGTARLWDSTTGEPLLTLTGHTGGVRGVAFSPDGTRLATTGDDGTAR
ncbi:MAG: pentapeptide repeat-containing protein, partial [Pseudonocardiaceae bacterium]